MKVALIVGHNKNETGAYSQHLKSSESDFFNKVCEIIKRKAPSVDVFQREDKNGYTAEMKPMIEQINKGGYDLALEMHFNAGGGSGVEMLHFYKSETGIKYSETLIKLHELVLGLKKRRLVPIKDNTQNGAYGILNSKMPYILTESFFGDNKDDCEKVSVKGIANVFLIFLYSLGVRIEEETETNVSTIIKSLEAIQEEINKIKEVLHVK